MRFEKLMETRNAIIIGIITTVALLIVMFLNGMFMHGDSEFECLSYAECESDDS